MVNSVEAFVQFVAVGCVLHGHWFYVCGEIPQGKLPDRVDDKLSSRYGAGLSRWERARRKRGGVASVRYVRFGLFFVLLATKGQGPFFEEEGERIRDLRRAPLRCFGYSISCRQGRDGKHHPSVRIELSEYKRLKAYFLELACHRSVEKLVAAFQSLPFEPYAPVRRQLLNIFRAVNRERGKAGFEPVPITALRLRRRVVKVFSG